MRDIFEGVFIRKVKKGIWLKAFFLLCIISSISWNAFSQVNMGLVGNKEQKQLQLIEKQGNREGVNEKIFHHDKGNMEVKKRNEGYGDSGSIIQKKSLQKQGSQASLVWVYDAWWGSVVDNDGDGKSSSRKLYFDVDANVGSISIYAKIYYEKNESGQWLRYYTTSDFTIQWNDSGDTYWILVGGENGELSGSYDFVIKIYQTGTSNLLATYGPADDDDLNDELFETRNEDGIQVYTIRDVWWQNIVDNDGDGYRSSGELWFDVNVNFGSGYVYAILLYEKDESGNWLTYDRTPNFAISGNSNNDKQYFQVGNSPNELSRGSYDFAIMVYDVNTDSLLTKIVAIDDEDINDELFESSSEDVAPAINFWVSNAWWTDAIDNDGDSYTSSRKLYFDVDVNIGTRNVYAEIYYEKNESGIWVFYYRTPAFSITGSENDPFWVLIGGSNGELGRGSYDFKIVVYNVETGQRVASRGPSDDADLNDELFESSAEEQVLSVGINDVFWTNVVDSDGDGYSASRDMNISLSGLQQVFLSL
jgi:hypothetical protein